MPAPRSSSVERGLTNLEVGAKASLPAKLPRRSTRLTGSFGALLVFAALYAQADPLPQVTIQGQRSAIEARVLAFVNDALYLQNGEAPPRWTVPVCPVVAGLSREEGEFVLARLSQIARAAGVPLGGERCKPPNLYVLASEKPVELLKQWGKLQHWRMFGDGTFHTIDSFIDRPEPVHVWYNASEGTVDGTMPTQDAPHGTSAGSDIRAPLYSGGDSRLDKVSTWSLTSAIVVVDKTRLEGVTRGQLADYIAMSVFLRVRTGAHYGDAPTILRIFDGASPQRPPGLTPWDEAFLESLYHTNPALGQQNWLIVGRMVKHLIPQ